MAVIEREHLRNFLKKFYNIELILHDTDIHNNILIEINDFKVTINKDLDLVDGLSLRDSIFKEECLGLVHDLIDEIKNNIGSFENKELFKMYIQEMLADEKSMYLSFRRIISQYGFYDKALLESVVGDECSINTYSFYSGEDMEVITGGIISHWSVMCMDMRDVFIRKVKEIEERYLGKASASTKNEELPDKDNITGTLTAKEWFIMYNDAGFFKGASFTKFSSGQQVIFVAEMIKSGYTHAKQLLAASRKSGKYGLAVSETHKKNIENYLREKQSDLAEKHTAKSKISNPQE